MDDLIRGSNMESSGLVLKIRGQYVSAVLANGHPDKPVVYFTEDLNQAKAWKMPKAARQARARIGRGGEILLYDGERGNRRLLGKLGKEGENHGAAD